MASREERMERKFVSEPDDFIIIRAEESSEDTEESK